MEPRLNTALPALRGERLEALILVSTLAPAAPPLLQYKPRLADEPHLSV